ncbi:MAG: PEPxxWA-CTERM sorting domain-containing protein [Caulobacteraceae bacterium]
MFKIMSIMRAAGLVAVSGAALALSAPAYAATTITFDSGGTKHGSGAGDYFTYNATIGGQAVSLTATGWTDNTNLNPDKIQSADLELYSGTCCGLGVTASGDSAYNETHTVDNVGGTKDFIVLKFSTAVDLRSADFNVFDVNQYGPADGDATAYYKNGATAPTNNGDPTNYFSQFTAISLPGSNSGSRNVAGAGIFSDTWIVAANMTDNYNNDGFKLYSITLDAQPGVPEPAAWGLMIVGTGLIGSQLRRRRSLAGAVA